MHKGGPFWSRFITVTKAQLGSERGAQKGGPRQIHIAPPPKNAIFMHKAHAKKHSPPPGARLAQGWVEWVGWVGWLGGWWAGWVAGGLAGLAGLAGWLVWGMKIDFDNRKSSW